MKKSDLDKAARDYATHMSDHGIRNQLKRSHRNISGYQKVMKYLSKIPEGPELIQIADKILTPVREISTVASGIADAVVGIEDTLQPSAKVVTRSIRDRLHSGKLGGFIDHDELIPNTKPRDGLPITHVGNPSYNPNMNPSAQQVQGLALIA